MANSLAVTQDTTFDGDGIAAIVIGPAIRGEVWNMDYLAVSTDSATDTEAYIYRDSVSPGNLIEASFAGNADKTNTSIRITAPGLLWIRWINGTPGARASLRIEGRREL
jgi:hypothetical protein